MVFFEDKMMYQLKGPVPEGEYTIPLGVADVKRVGNDITFVATSSMVQVALAAAESLQSDRRQRGSHRYPNNSSARQANVDRLSEKNQPGNSR